MKDFFLMNGDEMKFGYGLFVPDVLEVLGELLFTLEEFIIDDGINIFQMVHFSSFMS